MVYMCVLYYCFHFVPVVNQNISLNQIQRTEPCSHSNFSLASITEVMGLYDSGYKSFSRTDHYYPQRYVIQHGDYQPGFAIIAFDRMFQGYINMMIEPFPQDRNRPALVTHILCVCRPTRCVYEDDCYKKLPTAPLLTKNEKKKPAPIHMKSLTVNYEQYSSLGLVIVGFVMGLGVTYITVVCYVCIVTLIKRRAN